MLKTTAVAAARLGIALYIYEDKWYMANFGVDAEGNLSQPYYWHLEDPEWTCSPDDQTVLDNLQLWEDDGTDVLLPNATQPIYLALEGITQPFEGSPEYTIRWDDTTDMWYIWIDGERYNQPFWYEADAERYIPELD